MNGKCKLVLITWEDSRQSDGSWQWLSSFATREPVMVHSVGWLIQDGADAKVLAQSLAPDGDDVQAAGLKTIPTRCVTKIDRLAEVDDADEAREAAE